MSVSSQSLLFLRRAMWFLISH